MNMDRQFLIKKFRSFYDLILLWRNALKIIVIIVIFFFILFESIVLFGMMTVVFIAMLMVVELFLISCFDFWLSNDYESILNKFSNFLSLKLSCFWLATRANRA